MTTDFLAVNPELTVAETLAFIRLVSAEIENIYVIYVLDKQERLLGYLPINDLFSHPLDARLATIMNTRVKSIHSDSDDMEAAEIMAKYNLLSLPVVDKKNKLAGHHHRRRYPGSAPALDQEAEPIQAKMIPVSGEKRR